MAATDFPASPTVGQEYSLNGRTWVWDGTSWVSKGIPGAQGPQGGAGAQGPQGATGGGGTQGPQGAAGATGATGATGTGGGGGGGTGAVVGGNKVVLDRFLAPYYADMTMSDLGSDDATHGGLRVIWGFFDITGDVIGVVWNNGNTPGSAVTVRAGIYAVGSDGMPGALLAQSTPLSVSSAGVKTAVISSLAWTPKWACIVMHAYGATGVSINIGSTTQGVIGPSPTGQSSIQQWNTVSAYIASGCAFSAGLPSTGAGLGTFSWANTPTCLLLGLQMA